MNVESRFNEEIIYKARQSFLNIIEKDPQDGVELVDQVRHMVKLYEQCGFDIDEDIFSDILGMKSETDSLVASSAIYNHEMSHIYKIYNRTLKNAKKRLRKRFLGSTVK